jgi:3-dehydroquinate dehydratase
VIEPIARIQISGKGVQGYIEALEILVDELKEKR